MMKTTHPMAVGKIQSSSYLPVSAMQSDWEMSGDFHTWCIEMGEVSYTHTLITQLSHVHVWNEERRAQCT